jgi:hypothetical protein
MSPKHEHKECSTKHVANCLKRKLVRGATAVSGAINNTFVKVGDYVQYHILTEDYLLGILVGVIIFLFISRSRKEKIDDVRFESEIPVNKINDVSGKNISFGFLRAFSNRFMQSPLLKKIPGLKVGGLGVDIDSRSGPVFVDGLKVGSDGLGTNSKTGTSIKSNFRGFLCTEFGIGCPSS